MNLETHSNSGGAGLCKHLVSCQCYTERSTCVVPRLGLHCPGRADVEGEETGPKGTAARPGLFLCQLQFERRYISE